MAFSEVEFWNQKALELSLRLLSNSHEDLKKTMSLSFKIKSSLSEQIWNKWKPKSRNYSGRLDRFVSLQIKRKMHIKIW